MEFIIFSLYIRLIRDSYLGFIMNCIDFLLKLTNADLVTLGTNLGLQMNVSWNKDKLVYTISQYMVNNKGELQKIPNFKSTDVVSDIISLQKWMAQNTASLPVSPTPSPNVGATSINPLDLSTLIRIVQQQADNITQSNLALNAVTASLVGQGRNMEPFNHRVKNLSTTWNGYSTSNLEALNFLSNLEDLVNQFQSDWKTTAYALKASLRGKAALWFTAFQSEINSFSDFKDQFQQRFVQDTYLFTLENEIRTTKQEPDESMVEFASRLRIMNRKLSTPFTADQLLNFVKLNCHPKYLIAIDDLQPAMFTLPEVLKVAERIERAEEATRQYNLRTRAQRFPKRSDETNKRLSHAEVVQHHTEPTRNPETPPPHYPPPQQYTCFRCNEVGHFVKNCPLRKACPRCFQDLSLPNSCECGTPDATKNLKRPA